MREHREVELKWALAADEHHRLADALAVLLGAAQRLDQRNRFFDAADGRLRRAGLSIRVRRENARLVLTCKRKAQRSGSDGLFSHDEWERDLDPSLWPVVCAADPGLAEALQPPRPIADVLSGATLVGLGGFDNERLEWHDGDDLVCLDRTTFAADDVDHELEVETARPEATRARWVDAFTRLGVSPRPQTATKLARYLARQRT